MEEKNNERESTSSPINIANSDIKTVRFSLPPKDQQSTNMVKKQLGSLSKRLNINLQALFASRKIVDEVKLREVKLPPVNQQNGVYLFKCGPCNSDCVGHTCRHFRESKITAFLQLVSI